MKLPFARFGHFLLVPFLLVSSVALAGTDARHLGPAPGAPPQRTPHVEPAPGAPPQGTPRQVRIANNVRYNGLRYRDTQTGATLYLKGRRVVVTNVHGVVVRQYKTSAAAIKQRIDSGRWALDHAAFDLTKPYGQMTRQEQAMSHAKIAERKSDYRWESFFRDNGIPLEQAPAKPAGKKATAPGK